MITDKIAPNLIFTVKSLTKLSGSIPSSFWVIIIWPVEETGKNSVIPSTMAIIMV